MSLSVDADIREQLYLCQYHLGHREVLPVYWAISALFTVIFFRGLNASYIPSYLHHLELVSYLSVPQFPPGKMGMVTVSASEVCSEQERVHIRRARRTRAVRVGTLRGSVVGITIIYPLLPKKKSLCLDLAWGRGKEYRRDLRAGR